MAFLVWLWISNIAILLEGSFGGPEHVEAAVEGAMLGDYEPDRYKSEKKDVKVVDHFTVSAPGGGEELNRAAERGRTIAESQNFARELSTEPANKLTPTSLADAARQMAGAQGLEYLKPLRPARAVGRLHAVVREYSAALTGDRPMTADIEKVATAIREGKFAS